MKPGQGHNIKELFHSNSETIGADEMGQSWFGRLAYIESNQKGIELASFQT